MDGPGGGRRKLAGDRTAIDTVVLRIVHTGEEEQTAANGLVAGVGLADTGSSDILMVVLPVLPGHPVATGIERLRQHDGLVTKTGSLQLTGHLTAGELDAEHL